MPEPTEGEQEASQRVAEALASEDAARHLANLTGMTQDAAATYAAFHSGRWALASRHSL